MKYSADDLLLEREKRVEFLERLLQRYNMTVIFMRVNYPGLDKDNALSNNILKHVVKIVSDIFGNRILMSLFRVTAEGPTVVMTVNDDAVNVKTTTIEIEDKHMLGRCVDIDVYSHITGYGISRRDLGYEPRKCYLCKDETHNCVRSGKHSRSEIIKFIHNTYEDFMENVYGKKSCN